MSQSATTGNQTTTSAAAQNGFVTWLKQGYNASIVTTAYAFIISALAILNMQNDPRPSLIGDVLFVAMLGTFFVMHKMPGLSLTYKRVLLAVMIVGVLPYFGTLNQFYMDLMIQIGMFIVLAQGLNVVVGFAGLLDLGYIAFYAVGAYLWAIFSTPQAANFWVGYEQFLPLSPIWFFSFLFIAFVVGGITGVLLGLPVLRLRGDYLAIVTLGFGEVIRVLATNLDRPINITNGAQGIKDIGSVPLFLEPVFSGLAGLTGVPLSNASMAQLHYYTLVFIILTLMLIAVYRLANSRIGRAWTAIREDETAALAMGVPLVRMKLLAFATGACFAGVMGMVFAAKQTFINPPTFDLIRSISILSMVILGGMGSVPGAILGAGLVTLLNLQLLPRITSELDVLQLPAWLDPGQYQRLIFGLMLILMTIFRPQGLLPNERRQAEIQQPRDDDVPLPPDDDAPPPTDNADTPPTASPPTQQG